MPAYTLLYVINSWRHVGAERYLTLLLLLPTWTLTSTLGFNVPCVTLSVLHLYSVQLLLFIYIQIYVNTKMILFFRFIKYHTNFSLYVLKLRIAVLFKRELLPKGEKPLFWRILKFTRTNLVTCIQFFWNAWGQFTHSELEVKEETVCKVPFTIWYHWVRDTDAQCVRIHITKSIHTFLQKFQLVQHVQCFEIWVFLLASFLSSPFSSWR